MTQYILRRLLSLIPTLLGLTFVIFMFQRLIPGDPIQEQLTVKAAAAGHQNVDIQAWVRVYNERFGLNQPLWKQYLNYWWDLARLDFGYSLYDYPATVMSKIKAAIPWTIGFMSVAILLAFLVGSALGALLAWPNSPRWIQGMVPFLMVISSIPFYLFGLALIWIFAVELRILPSGGGHDPIMILRRDWKTAVDIIEHAILPALALVLWAMWGLVRGLSSRALMYGQIVRAEHARHHGDYLGRGLYYFRPGQGAA